MAKSRRKKSEEASEGAPEWMLTYSDLVTLLLTFFILLFSMATIDKQKFIEVANSLRSRFLHVSSGEMFYTNTGKDLFSITEQNNAIDREESDYNNDPAMKTEEEKQLSEQMEKLQERKLEEVEIKLKDAIKKLNLENFVSVVEEQNYLILRFNSVLLFDLGSADIKESGKEVLLKLGQMLKSLENDIMVQGHTDNLPINTKLFPTNWELSTKRATNVVLYLINNCGHNPQTLTAAGNGEFKPVVPNDTEENRQKNRRIDIMIER